jgi:hypothetical protein
VAEHPRSQARAVPPRDRIALTRLTAELREVNAEDAPTRVRFAFDRSLDDPNLTFRY